MGKVEFKKVRNTTVATRFPEPEVELIVAIAKRESVGLGDVVASLARAGMEAYAEQEPWFRKFKETKEK